MCGEDPQLHVRKTKELTVDPMVEKGAADSCHIHSLCKNGRE